MILVYLAIPYSGMEESSFKQANEATVALLKMGYNVFSPITHSHPLRDYGVPGTWDFWSQIDYQFLDKSDELWVIIPKEGIGRVFNSVGVQSEIKYFEQRYKKPVRLIQFNDLLKEANEREGIEIQPG